MVKIIKILFVLSIVLSLGIFIVRTDLHLVRLSLLAIKWRFVWLILITFLAYFLGTIAWKLCLGKEGRSVSLFHLYWIRLISETVSMFNPSSIIGGELLKVELVKPYITQENTIINSVIISRLLTISSQLLMCTLAFILLAGQHHQSILNISAPSPMKTIIFLGVALAILVGLYRFGKSIAFFNRLVKRVQIIVSQIRKHCYREKWMLCLAFLVFCLHWFVGSLEFYLILRFLNADIQLIDGLMMDMGVIVFKSLGAFVPGQLGIEEYGNKLMLIAFGFKGMALWLSVSILRRARQLVWIVLSILYYTIPYKKLIRLQAL
ncbi:flippase-like domain-containing protein [Olivibacter sp. SDN3]|uniref:lysylphosphatidylglycerol synthase transmembrane domain-containing protein n=1 Tax=Olivibacter sp. SDN3 TaxID=2764720 RepID=UPI00165121BF|nr:lysylphosphatidylglycerol synthase transmembrane domain-containing protein [Olivibacter sp. SDN3]QNL49463.1 flippase-like domain-containing protein [Olivibacter sp. SDN3]